MLNVKNNCNYPVSVTYKSLLSKVSKENYLKIPPGFEYLGAGMLYVGCNESEEEAIERCYSADESVQNNFHILYPGGCEEVLSSREFAAKADAQTGKDGRGSWTLTLCPDNENPPPSWRNDSSFSSKFVLMGLADLNS